MAFIHGSKAKIRVDNSAGSLIDLSPYVASVSFPRSLDTADTTVLGSTAKQYVTGQEDATISLDGKFDPTLDAHMDGIKFGLSAGGSVTVQFDPQGTAGGLPRWTAEAWLTSYEVSADVGDAGTWSAQFQVTGGVTRSTQ